MRCTVTANARTILLQQQLAAVHELRRTEFISPSLMCKIGRTNFNSPTFKKLFSHRTWELYTGIGGSQRWRQMLLGWTGSSILRAVLPRTLFVTAWATLVVLLGRQLPMSPIALQLQGTAIGLLLVFRNDAAYSRLAEARGLMGKIILLGREIASGAVTYLSSDADGHPSEAAYSVCRLMAIFGWCFKARLRDGESAADVIRAVLPEEEASWLLAQRSPAVAIIAKIRKLLAEQFERKRLAPHLHLKLEANLLELYQVVFFTASSAYIFFGTEELGVQVEQPFDILPLWQICHLATRNVEEAAFALNRAAPELAPYNYTTPTWDSVPVGSSTVGAVDQLRQMVADRFAPIWQGAEAPEAQDTPEAPEEEVGGAAKAATIAQVAGPPVGVKDAAEAPAAEAAMTVASGSAAAEDKDAAAKAKTTKEKAEAAVVAAAKQEASKRD